MCAIVGVSGDWDCDLVQEILKWSRIRGLHSFGFSYFDKSDLRVEKFLEYEKFVERLLLIHPKRFIAHFRYSTSGDWKNELNNQPISNGECSVVFNGVIDMGTKSEMEISWNLKLQGENDGEIALQKIDNLDLVIKKQSVSFAGLFLKDDKIIAVRNDKRPLHFAKKDDVCYLASTSDILLRSGFKKTKLLKEYEQHRY